MVYYLEINLLAISVALILLLMGRRVFSRNETSQIIMDRMLRLLILLSAADIAAYFFRGKSYVGVEISNTLFFLAAAVGSYQWFLYILVKVGLSGNIKRTVILTGIPIALTCIGIILNPLTNFFFSIDSSIIYHRGPGVILTWIVEWGYLIAAVAVNVRLAHGEKKYYRKRELRGYLLFAVPLAVSALVQMLCYGTTTLQAGFLIAMLMVWINKQQYMVQRDELTGLNNSNAFHYYQDSLDNQPGGSELTALILDVDNFKAINDIYGHLKGDQALKCIADALKTSVGSLPDKHVLLFRCGGDEFAVIGTNMSNAQTDLLVKLIVDNLAMANEQNHLLGEGYHLSVSIGRADGFCLNQDDFSILIRRADEDMYQVKSAKKGIRRMDQT